MSRSLFSSASGLLSHQRKLDVVANNLANVNTTGYKAQRIAFADLIYQTLSSGKNVEYMNPSSGEVSRGRVSEITMSNGKLAAVVGNSLVDINLIKSISV